MMYPEESRCFGENIIWINNGPEKGAVECRLRGIAKDASARRGAASDRNNSRKMFIVVERKVLQYRVDP